MRELAWTLSFLRPYRLRVAGIVGLAIAEVGLAALAPWPMKAIVDNVFGGHAFPGALDATVRGLAGGRVGVLLVMVALAGFALQLTLELVRAAHTPLQVDTGQRVAYALREGLLAHMQALPMRHHVTGRTGEAVYRIDADAYCVNDLVISGVFPLATAALTLAVMFVVLLTLDATLALLSLVVAPFLYVCLRYYSRTMTDRAERVKAQESSLLERAFEVVSSIAAVKSFARERHEQARFSAVGVETMRARLRLTWQESLFSIWVTAISSPAPRWCWSSAACTCSTARSRRRPAGGRRLSGRRLQSAVGDCPHHRHAAVGAGQRAAGAGDAGAHTGGA